MPAKWLLQCFKYFHLILTIIRILLLFLVYGRWNGGTDNLRHWFKITQLVKVKSWFESVAEKTMNQFKILTTRKKRCYGEVEQIWIKHKISKTWTKERKPTAALCGNSRKTHKLWVHICELCFPEFISFVPIFRLEHTDLRFLLRSQSFNS